MDRFLKRTEVDVAGPSTKKRKNNQAFLDDYTETWPCLIASMKSGYARCTTCNSDFSVEHGGRDDCRKHVNTSKHLSMRKVVEKNTALDSFFSKKKDDFEIIRAECLFTRFLVEHNIPLSVADHAKPLFNKMFPDSSIAKKFSCGRTKASSIVRSLAHDERDKVAQTLRNAKFSLATDGSNDIADRKIYPLITSYFDKDKGQVVTTLLSLLESNNNTGEGIFNLIDEEFSKLNIPWRNCIALSVDNTNSMVGKNKGLASFVLSKQPKLKVVGCPCHLLHRNAQNAVKVLPVDVEMLIVQLYYFLEKSSKRKSTFKEYQSLCQEEPHKILKHVSTRWLSLENSLNRVLEQWEPLKMFLDKMSQENKQASEIKTLFESPETKLYCLFVKSVLPTFVNSNTILQKEEPMIHILSAELQKFYFELLARFVKPSAIKECESVFDVQYYKKKNQKDDDDLVIGARTRSYLAQSNIDGQTRLKFFSSVREFFSAACNYAIKKLPLQDEFFKNAGIANIDLRDKATFTSVRYFADIFELDEDIVDKLELEFSNFQCEHFTPMIKESIRIDRQWDIIKNLKYADGTYKYVHLPNLMLSILSIPHSNATTERVFSIVRKNQTEFRASMCTKTLESLIVGKLSMNECYAKTFSELELKNAKSACYKDNNENCH